jgi:hypothetical protein
LDAAAGLIREKRSRPMLYLMHVMYTKRNKGTYAYCLSS